MSKSKTCLRRRLWYRTFGTSKVGVCHWCGNPIHFDEATVDHEPPLAEGGDDQHVFIACSPCNQRRGQELLKKMNARNRRVARKSVNKPVAVRANWHGGWYMD